jgi:hypothetical protein
MGKLVDKLHEVSQTTGSGIGFLGGRGPTHKPRPAALFVALGAGDAAAAEAATKSGVDGLFITGWSPGADLSAIKPTLDSKGVVWGVELSADAAAGKDALKSLAEAGASFAVIEPMASARVLFEEVEKFDLVAAMQVPQDDLGLLLVRTQSLLPAQVGLLRADLATRDLARLSIGDYARLRTVVESVRFPMLVTLKEAPESGDVSTLVHLGVAGLVLSGRGASAQQLGADVKALRETLEKTPLPREERDNILLSGFMPTPGQAGAPGQPHREPEREPERE